MQTHYFSFTKTFFVLLAGFCMQQGLAQDAMFIAPNGNVGIGTNMPQSNLSVQGTANISGNMAIGTGNIDPQKALFVSGNGYFTGNVGIGVYAPQDKLSVEGNASFTGNVGIGTTSPVAKIEVGGNPNDAFRTAYLNISANNTSVTDRTYFRGLNDHFVLAPRTTGNSTMYLAYPSDMATGTTTNTLIQETIFISATGSGGNGNVGIGTMYPTQGKLVVNGTMNTTLPPITYYSKGESGCSLILCGAKGKKRRLFHNFALEHKNYMESVMSCTKVGKILLEVQKKCEKEYPHLLLSGDLLSFERLLMADLLAVYNQMSAIMLQLTAQQLSEEMRKKGEAMGMSKLEKRGVSFKISTGCEVIVNSYYGCTVCAGFEGSRYPLLRHWGIIEKCSPSYYDKVAMCGIISPSYVLSNQLLTKGPQRKPYLWLSF